MSEPAAEPVGKVLAVITSDSSLHRALRDRAELLNVTRKSISLAAGLTESHAEKLLSPTPMKRMGEMSRYAMVGALNAQLVLISAPAQNSKLEQRREKVGMLAVKVGRGKQRILSMRFMRKIAKKGGRARAEKLSPKRRTEIARKGAKARWHKPKITEIKSNKSQ